MDSREELYQSLEGQMVTVEFADGRSIEGFISVADAERGILIVAVTGVGDLAEDESAREPET